MSLPKPEAMTAPEAGEENESWSDYYKESIDQYTTLYNLDTVEDNVFNKVMSRVFSEISPPSAELIDYYCISEDPDDQVDGLVEVIEALASQLNWVYEMLESMLDSNNRHADTQTNQGLRSYSAFLKAKNLFSPLSVLAFMASMDTETSLQFENFLKSPKYRQDTLEAFAMVRFLSNAPPAVTSWFGKTVEDVLEEHKT